MYILIAILFNIQTGAVATVTTQEFNTLETCNAAKVVFEQAVPYANMRKLECKLK